MFHTFRHAAVFLTAVATLVLGATSASAADQGVPLKVQFAGSAAFSGPSSTSFVGSGNASLMGHIATRGDAQITCFPPDPSSRACVSPDDCPGGVPNVNTETLAAASGDTLTIKSLDIACPIGPAGSNQYHGTGQWTVQGGTGRFANATGRGSFDGHSDFNAGTFAATLTGTIAY